MDSDASSFKAEIFERICATLAGLIFTVLDASALYSQEYKFIFRSPPTKIKWVYLFARYYGIACQIANTVFAVGPLSSLPVPSVACAAWFYLQMISFTLLLFVMEVILSLRVFAFYRKNRIVGLGLLLLVGMEVSSALMCIFYLVPRLQYNSACILVETPSPTLSLGGSVLITQCTIWLLTFFRYRKGRRYGWADVPVVSRVMRDGGIVFIASIGIIVIITPYSFRVKDLSHIVSSLFCAVFSVVTCRLILNMQNLISSERTVTSAVGLGSLGESEESLDSVYDLW
ncbi:hypothetical protein CPC08DRAFT_700843 [Agrocybe pediades]|nr:hypothetical protein CPC08DRAFT_700843 [Agrocybe pediades]